MALVSTERAFLECLRALHPHQEISMKRSNGTVAYDVAEWTLHMPKEALRDNAGDLQAFARQTMEGIYTQALLHMEPMGRA